MVRTCRYNDEIICTVESNCNPMCPLHPKHNRGNNNREKYENTI
jgi:hypothetical protein